MNSDKVNDLTLMAYADGALDAAEAARVAQMVAADPILAQRLAGFTGTRDALAALRRKDDDNIPLPTDLQAKLRAQINAAAEAKAAAPANLLPFARKSRGLAPFWSGALAASLALAVGLGAGYFMASQPAGSDNLALAAALDRAPSGSEEHLADGTVVRLVSSFYNAQGAFCREYERRQPTGAQTIEVACDAGTGWQMQLMLAFNDTEGYAPAAAPELLDLYFTQSAAGAPLSVAQEQSALATRGR
ncbi:hypothetical protein [Yoonia sp.]|uniref:anti-sigma factor family protein n=1 Tax=Yoonia sp. TaxID=2212373 RepID=UPI0019EE28FE|nr:hypothetical protein [Yoonia sp.]MBE0413534.1 hypothetical protein [Yoonia sp.]